MAKKKSGNNLLEVQNASKTLHANLRFLSVDDPIKSIVMTSSVPNEGKSTTSVNLAQAIAASGQRVLLVECDMRRRSLAAVLGAHARYGLYSVLSESVTLLDAVVPTSTAGLDFLDAEPHIPNPADLIASRRFARLVAAAEAAYDYVIFDTPPVGTFVDAAVLSTLADATVLVVRPNLVRRDELVAAYEQLQKAGANVVGTCATFVEGSSSEYYYEYYTKDGKKAKGSKDAGRGQQAQVAPPAARGRQGAAGAGDAAAAARRGGAPAKGAANQAKAAAAGTQQAARNAKKAGR